MDHDQTETATRRLHRLTSYVPDREWDVPVDDPLVLQDFVPNDVDRHPPLVKSYADGLPRTALPRELPVGDEPTLSVLAGTAAPAPTPLDLAGLSRILYLSAGVVRTSQRSYGAHLFRAAGSAGGRFPLELYVAIPQDAGPDLPPGVHWYDPVDHALVQVGPAPEPATTAGATTVTAPTVIVTGIPWRTGWRYAERGYRHVFWDGGTMLSQLLALAESAGHAPRLFTRFPDAPVSDLVGADRVHEWPVALVALGDGAPSITPTGPATAGLVDTAPLEFPLVTDAQHAGDLDHLGDPWVPGVPTPAVAADSPTLDDVIVKRGSQRRMDPSRGLPLETLRACMTVATRGIDVRHWIAVHDVSGLAPGLYEWPHLDRPVRAETGDEMRADLYRICLDQSLARDAAFVVVAATDVSALSDREYREAQLAAGIVEGRLHLAAYALGAGATGMTFLDSEIPALLAASGAALPDGLIFTCVGVPGNTSKPAGQPGAPTEVRRVEPRE
jgi:SagB-type dehydrogenase family enzyme